MKKPILILFPILFFLSQVQSQVNLDVEGDAIISGNLGIGTTATAYKVHVVGEDDLIPTMLVENIADNEYTFPAIVGKNDLVDSLGIGVSGKGGIIGVHGQTNASGDRLYIGVRGEAKGGVGTNYGVYGIAFGGERNYGVFGQGTMKAGGKMFVNTFNDQEDANLDKELLVRGQVMFEEIGVRRFYIPQWAPAANKQIIGGVYEGQEDLAPLVRYIAPNEVYVDLGVDTLGNFNLKTSDFLALSALPDGKMAVGPTTPGGRLQIKQVNTEPNLVLENDDTDGSDYWGFEVGENDINVFYDSDGPDPLAPSQLAYVSAIDGSWNTSSDASLKKDINPITESILPQILELKPSTFRYKHADDQAQKTLGFIAQDVELIFPEAVKEREDGKLAMNYNDMAVLAIKAIQEQQELIDDLNKSFKDLKTENEELKKQLVKLESLNKN